MVTNTHALPGRPRRFADVNGTGDLAGLPGNLDHLRGVEIGAI